MDLFAFISWNPDVEMFSIGSLHIRYYSMCWLVGLFLAYLIVKRLYRQQGISNDLFEPVFMYCFFGVLIGARLGHCLFYQPEYYLTHPVEMLLPIQQTSDGWKFTGYEGLASHGGVIGMLISLWIYAHRTKLSYRFVLDNIGIAAPMTGCCIRLGNLMNSEIVGLPTDMPWGFIFLHNGENFARHPAQLYEALFYLLVFLVGYFVVYRRYAHRVGTGFFFGYCLTMVFLFRFFIEFIKERQVSFEESMMLDMGQWLSIPLIIIGIACMVWGWKAKPVKNLK